MTKRLFRTLVLTALAPLALGGAFGHVDGFELLSKGTFFFPPDHPAHAPFVPEKEHPSPGRTARERGDPAGKRTCPSRGARTRPRARMRRREPAARGP